MGLYKGPSKSSSIHPLALLTSPQKWAWHLVRLSLLVSDGHHFLRQTEFHVLRAGIGSLEVTLLGSGVAGVGHRRPLGEWLSEAQSAENGRIATVILPGGLLVNVWSWVMKRESCSLHLHVAVNQHAIHPSRADYPKSQNSRVSCSLRNQTDVRRTL